MFYIIEGNPIEGFKVIGLFETEKQAQEWRDMNLTNFNNWIGELIPFGKYHSYSST